MVAITTLRSASPRSTSAKRHVSPLTLRRAIVADGWLPRLRRTFRSVLASTARDASQAILDGAGASHLQEFAAEWERRFLEAKESLVPAMTMDGYDYAEREARDLKAKAIPAEQLTIAQLNAQLETLLESRFRVEVAPWLEQTAALETKTTLARYSQMIKTNITGGATLQETARAVLAMGLAQSRTRAELMARTSSIWAYNKGATLRYKESGFHLVDWILTYDDQLCEFCEEIASRSPMEIDKPFMAAGEELHGISYVEDREGASTSTLSSPWNVEHPPAHPFCRCAIAVSSAEFN